jgi:hypothetical protein
MNSVAFIGLKDFARALTDADLASFFYSTEP